MSIFVFSQYGLVGWRHGMASESVRRWRRVEDLFCVFSDFPVYGVIGVFVFCSKKLGFYPRRTRVPLGSV
jgi:hypothetical protein